MAFNQNKVSSHTTKIVDMNLSNIIPTYSLEYVLERSVENIIGFLRISKPEKALQVLIDLQTYMQSQFSRPFGHTTPHDYSQPRMKLLVERMREEIVRFQGPEEDSSMLMGVLETLEQLTLFDSMIQAPTEADASQEEFIDTMMIQDGRAGFELLPEGDVVEIECHRCGGLYPKRRMEQHLEFWCQRSSPQDITGLDDMTS